MPILVKCACGKSYRVKDEYQGKKVKCPTCNASFVAQGEPVTTHDVFISYSSTEKAMADAMCATLEANKLRCWIAPRDIIPGKSWGGSIVGALTHLVQW